MACFDFDKITFSFLPNVHRMERGDVVKHFRRLYRAFVMTVGALGLAAEVYNAVCRLLLTGSEPILQQFLQFFS